jgi:predicted Zn-dependent protease
MDNAAVNLAASLLRTGQPAEAIPLLERVCQRLPDWADAQYNLGLAYAGAGNPGAARRQAALLMRLSPPHARSLSQQIKQSADASPPE